MKAIYYTLIDIIEIIDLKYLALKQKLQPDTYRVRIFSN